MVFLSNPTWKYSWNKWRINCYEQLGKNLTDYEPYCSALQLRAFHFVCGGEGCIILSSFEILFSFYSLYYKYKCVIHFRLITYHITSWTQNVSSSCSCSYKMGPHVFFFPKIRTFVINYNLRGFDVATNA